MNNVYGTVSVPDSTPTIINGVTGPNRAPYSFKGIIIWASVDCDIEVKFNTDTIGGGCITGAQPFLFIDYSSSPYGVNPQDVISVLATQTSGDPEIVKSTLLVEQL